MKSTYKEVITTSKKTSCVIKVPNSGESEWRCLFYKTVLALTL